MKVHSQTQRNYILEGANQDKLLQRHVQSMLGFNADKKVESKRHTIISGPPGVGKTFTTRSAILAGNKNFIQFGAGASPSNIALKLAYAVHTLPEGEELIVLIDDADDIVFGDYVSANRFKLAMAGEDPAYIHDKNLHTQRLQFEKAGRTDLVEAIDAFTAPGSTGMAIPMDNVRFIIICNVDLEQQKMFRGKVWSAVQAIVDRVKYKRLDFEWKVSWGWLAYILSNTQPFKNFELTDEQKTQLVSWLWDKWEMVRSPSYRTVEEMAEYMINNPDDYEDEWASLLKVKK